MSYDNKNVTKAYEGYGQRPKMPKHRNENYYNSSSESEESGPDYDSDDMRMLQENIEKLNKKVKSYRKKSRGRRERRNRDN